MNLQPVQQRPLFRIRCGQMDKERGGARCWHDATVADLDAAPFSMEAYYCDKHKPEVPREVAARSSTQG